MKMTVLLAVLWSHGPGRRWEIVWASRNKLVREVKFAIIPMAFLVLAAMTVLHAVLALFGEKAPAAQAESAA